MSATVATPPRVMTTGMTLVSPVAIPDAAVLEICTALEGPSLAAARWPKDDEALGVLAFGGAGELALAIVRRETPDVASERPDAAFMLGAPIVDALRLDVMLRPDEMEPLVRAETALVALAHAVCHRFQAIALDDLGQIYDPAEIARLAARSEPRALAFSYALAATLRATSEMPLDIRPPALSETAGREAPTDPFPDYADDERAAFAIRGTHVPLTLLARITLALANDARTNPSGLRVAAFAPNVAAAEGLRLAAFGVDLTDVPAARDVRPRARGSAAPVLRTSERNEIDVFARSLSIDEAVALVRELAEDLARDDAALFSTPPAIRDDARLAVPGFPELIAGFDLPGAGLDVYHLDLAVADDVFRRFVGTRAEISLLLSGDVGSAIAIEYYASAGAGDSGPPAPSLRAADALATLISSAYVERTDGIACDAVGAIYGGEELARLATRRLGRADSWSARLAAFGLTTTTP